MKKQRSLCSMMPEPSYGDLDKIRLDIKLSQNLYKASLAKANELGMTYHGFIEVAILSALPGSASWNSALTRKHKLACKSAKVRQMSRHLNKLKKSNIVDLEEVNQTAQFRRFKKLGKIESKTEALDFINEHNLKLTVKAPGEDE